ncbi:metallophosphoesterase [Bifidobacterium callitrichidarum]|uniref:Serine/threonine protein phosphatase n=1 Tax=Bifidobacterium callitrichidarum TaxID=2052941 RepID=A0A2U2NAL2_9BIFI|nr:metallophosphoesterase [Bifidobacterium callitrichidarum]PWG66152.1 serine/threonine protein phosphatase [Bifidobacterium callitrichidarum]
MTETQRAPEGMTKPRIKPADAEDDRPVSISARLGRLQFHHSGKFRVLQIADIQDGPKIAKDTMALIEASLDASRPDLVIFSGNQIAGYDPAFAATFRKRRWRVEGEGSAADESEAARAAALEDTRQLVRKAVWHSVEPLVKRGIPWAVTYGNHDFQCGLSDAELDAIYREFPGCVNPGSFVGASGESNVDGDAAVRESGGAATPVVPANGLLSKQTIYTCGPDGTVGVIGESEPADDGGPAPAVGGAAADAVPCEPGTFALPVMDVDCTRDVLGLVLVNSGDYARGGGFGTPSDAAMAFLRVLPEHIDAKSMVFQHMPLPEYYQVLRPVAATAAFAMQGYREHASTYYVLDEDKTQLGGYLGEGISCPDRSEEFAVLRDSEGYIGVVAGHDHRNGFVGETEGLLLMATPTCGFNTYGPAPAKRATRLIEFDIRHPYEPRTQLLEFGELVGKPSSKRAYTYAVNQQTPGEGEGDDLLRKPSLWSQLTGLFK